MEYDKINGIVKCYQNVTDYERVIREGLTDTNDRKVAARVLPRSKGNYGALDHPIPFRAGPGIGWSRAPNYSKGFLL